MKFMIDDTCFNDFLQNAAGEVHSMWQDAGGEEMDEHEFVALNEVLTQFFADKREG